MPKLVNTDDVASVKSEDIEVEEIKDERMQDIEDIPETEEEDDLDSLEIGDTEEYWSGGPTGAQVKEWKSVYGDIYVTSVTPDNHIVWRTLTRFEYRRLVKSLDQQSSSGQVTQAEANLNNEESIAETVILFPEYQRDKIGTYMAGIASLISQEAMEASGFVALEIRQL